LAFFDIRTSFTGTIAFVGLIAGTRCRTAFRARRHHRIRAIFSRPVALVGNITIAVLRAALRPGCLYGRLTIGRTPITFVICIAEFCRVRRTANGARLKKMIILVANPAAVTTCFGTIVGNRIGTSLP
jgi:hypothetical protein